MPKLPLGYLAFLGTAAAVPLAVNSPQPFLQLVLIGLVLLPLALSVRVREHAGSLPPAYRFGALGLLALMIGGQATNDFGKMFPFVAWTMFGTPPDTETAEWFSVEATLDDGETAEINPSALFPSLDRGTLRLPIKLRDLIREGESSRPTVAKMLLAFAEAHERRYGVEVSSVRLVQHRTAFPSLEDDAAILMEQQLP